MLAHPLAQCGIQLLFFSQVAGAVAPDSAAFVLNATPRRGLFDWLLDLLAAVAMHEVRHRPTDAGSGPFSCL